MNFSTQARLLSRELWLGEHLLKEDQLKEIRKAVINFITASKKDI